MRTAILIGSLCALLGPWASPVGAHEGHDHGDEKAQLPNLGNAPMRQADGSVFLPKSAQRRMGIRTEPVTATTAVPSLELAGRVVADPQRAGRVQTQVGGRLAAPGAWPMAGSRVKRGQVLAWVEPAVSAEEKAQVAALRAELGLAERRVERLQALADTVPRKEIEAAGAELASLRGRLAALGGGAAGREVLVAPVSGVIAASHARLGEVVDARSAIFEIVDPDSLVVEVLAYEPLAVRDITGATLAQDGQVWSMQLLGAARQLREQALPLLFAHRGPDAGLALPIGQPVKIQALLRSTAQNGEKPATGWPVAQSALMRSAANEPMVWVKRGPEHFEPRPVRSRALDGARRLVEAGLADGDRVVVEGAALISQIR